MTDGEFVVGQVWRHKKFQIYFRIEFVDDGQSVNVVPCDPAGHRQRGSMIQTMRKKTLAAGFSVQSPEADCVNRKSNAST